jgi:hypothetical protein
MNSSQPSESPDWAEPDSWFSGWAQGFRKPRVECNAEILWNGSWFECGAGVHSSETPHRNAGWNHNLFWDDSGYWENRII